MKITRHELEHKLESWREWGTAVTRILGHYQRTSELDEYSVATILKTIPIVKVMDIKRKVR